MSAAIRDAITGLNPVNPVDPVKKPLLWFSDFSLLTSSFTLLFRDISQQPFFQGAGDPLGRFGGNGIAYGGDHDIDHGPPGSRHVRRNYLRRQQDGSEESEQDPIGVRVKQDIEEKIGPCFRFIGQGVLSPAATPTALEFILKRLSEL